MKSVRIATRWVLYAGLCVGAAFVSLMGYDQVMLARSEKGADQSTWLPKQQVAQLMRFHGTDILKITQEEVFIPRGTGWISVLRRDRD